MMMSPASASAPVRESTKTRARVDQSRVHLALIRPAGTDRADVRAVGDPSAFDHRLA